MKYIYAVGPYDIEDGEVYCTADNLIHLIEGMIYQKYITENTNIWCDRLEQWISLKAYYGDNWKEQILKWTEEDFVDYFNEYYYIQKVPYYNS